MKNFFLTALILMLFGCKEEKLSVNKNTEIRFRRSYVSKSDDYDQINKSNPSPIAGNDSVIMKTLKESGILDSSYCFIRDRFPFYDSTSFELQCAGKEKITGWFARPAGTNVSDQYNLILKTGNKKKEVMIEGNYGLLNEDIRYLLLDIIPGGCKEIVVLNEYYIMNGDNSDLLIYQVNN